MNLVLLAYVTFKPTGNLDNYLLSWTLWKASQTDYCTVYFAGLVVLVTLETGAEVHKFEVPEGVTSLSWQQHATPAATTTKVHKQEITSIPSISLVCYVCPYSLSNCSF